MIYLTVPVDVVGLFPVRWHDLAQDSQDSGSHTGQQNQTWELVHSAASCMLRDAGSAALGLYQKPSFSDTQGLQASCVNRPCSGIQPAAAGAGSTHTSTYRTAPSSWLHYFTPKPTVETNVPTVHMLGSFPNLMASIFNFLIFVFIYWLFSFLFCDIPIRVCCPISDSPRDRQNLVLLTILNIYLLWITYVTTTICGLRFYPKVSYTLLFMFECINLF